jgi:hypothetical protein
MASSSATDRVRKNTDERVQGRIERRTLENVARFAALGPQAVDARLVDLDREWDVERILQANAAGVSIVGLVLGAATRNRRWFLLPSVAAGFLLMHAIEGWCPPASVLRRLGFRTQREIDDERTALKALRGDFGGFDPSGKRTDARRAWEAARA